MRALRLLILLPAALVAASCSAATPAESVACAGVPDMALTGPLIDGGQMLGASQEQAVTAAISDYEQRSGRQLVVVTIASLNGLRIDNYARCLGDRWGIGDARRNDGLVVRLATGRGAEALLTDDEAQSIVKAMTAQFRSGDFGGGLLTGIAQVEQQMGQAQAAGR
jgi:uncharacterized protein